MAARESNSHLPEYAMEACHLGVFMLLAVLVSAGLDSGAARALVTDPTARRVIAGVAMGLTAIAIIYSPWGRRSGAHFNPAVTLTFLRLGKIKPSDAAAYIGAQFTGGLLGVIAGAGLLRLLAPAEAPTLPVTVPGEAGLLGAFAGEFAIAFTQLTLVLHLSNHERFAPYTGLAAGVGVAAFISVEAPLSGMSMNPARTLATAIPAGVFDGLWIYFTAPLLGMLVAAQVFCVVEGRARVKCCKLHHTAHDRCIFNCGYCTHASA